MAEVLIIGWIMLDLVGHVDALPASNRAVVASDFDAACAGRAASQALAISAIEGEVALLARIGADQHADLLRTELVELGVDDHLVTPAPAVTGVRMIARDDVGDQRIVVCPGANEYLTVDDINRRTAAFGAAQVVGVTAEPAGAVALRTLELAAMHNARTVLTHTPQAQLTDRLLAAAEVVVVSSSLADGLLDSGLANARPQDAGRALVQRGARAVVVLTSSGAALVTAERAEWAASPSALDHEDAVDAFVGGMMTAMARGATLADASIRGVRASCLLVD